MHLKRKQKGFTLVELLLATAFFSFILLFVLNSFIQINRSYTRGVTVKRVQDSTRLLMEDITRNVRGSSAGNVTIVDNAVDTEKRLCLGNGVRYAWNEYLNTTGTPPTVNFSQEKSNGKSFSIVRVEDTAGCTDSISDTDASQLLPDNLIVQDIKITQLANGVSYKIQLVISTDDKSNFNELSDYGENAECRVAVGDQYCDVTVLETVVSVRN